MLYLFLLFVLLPAFELYLLIELGTWVGAGRTFAIIVVTGFVGAALVKQQGLGVFRRIQAESAEGRLPAIELVEGLVLLVAGALLVTPGLVTDAAGFLALIPPLRRQAAKALADRMVVAGSASVFQMLVNQAGSHRPPSDGVVDVEPRPVDPEPKNRIDP